jgi:hypothetical protein
MRLVFCLNDSKANTRREIDGLRTVDGGVDCVVVVVAVDEVDSVDVDGMFVVVELFDIDDVHAGGDECVEMSGGSPTAPTPLVVVVDDDADADADDGCGIDSVLTMRGAASGDADVCDCVERLPRAPGSIRFRLCVFRIIIYCHKSTPYLLAVALAASSADTVLSDSTPPPSAAALVGVVESVSVFAVVERNNSSTQTSYKNASSFLRFGYRRDDGPSACAVMICLRNSIVNKR